MQTVETLDQLRAARQSLPSPLGFVPTMGFLHEGHLSLVDIARQRSQSVAASIFVNPSQFGPGEDLDAYPRDIPRDLELLASRGVDLVWMPTPEIIYPQGYQTWIDLETITQPLEGAKRPGHFRGVATVVAKLFNAVQPDLAVFGQKDAQQVAVIQQMVRDLNIPVEILVGPIVRESDGLAMSSRNSYLDPDQRQAATVLYRALTAASSAYQAGERSASAICALMEATIQSEPLARLEYVSCADALSLQELEMIEGQALLSMAVFVGQTRLIDNLLLGKE